MAQKPRGEKNHGSPAKSAGARYSQIDQRKLEKILSLMKGTPPPSDVTTRILNELVEAADRDDGVEPKPIPRFVEYLKKIQPVRDWSSDSWGYFEGIARNWIDDQESGHERFSPYA